MVKASAYNAGYLGLIPGLGRPLEKEMAAHSSIVTWKIPWTEEPGRLQSMGHKELNMTEGLSLSLFFIPRRELPNHMVDLFSGFFFKEPPYCFP